MTTYLCTAGTSIATSTGLDLRHMFSHELSEWTDFFEDVEVARQFVLEKIMNKSDEELPRSSAEINSLVKMGMTIDDRVVLIATETIEGKLCAQLVAEILKKKYLCAEVTVEIVEGLQARDGKRFSQVGLKNLVNLITRFEHQNVVFNPTGGFKSVVPYITLAGMLFNKPVKYIHEFSDDLITLVNFPISFDEDLIFKLEEKFALIDLESAICKSDWKKGIDYQTLQRAESLIEEIDNGITLSGLGLMVWERFKLDYPLYLTRDMSPPRSKYFNIELIEDSTEKSVKPNAVEVTSLTHHGHEKISKVANRVLASPFISAVLHGCDYQRKTTKTEVKALNDHEAKKHLQTSRINVCLIKLKSDEGFAFLVQTTARNYEENLAIANQLNHKFFT